MAVTVFSFLVTCAICCGIFYYMMWHFRRRRLYEMASKFDGPRPLPFIGNAHLFVGDNALLQEKSMRVNDLYPSPSRVWIGSQLWVYISDPEHLKTICLSPNTLEKSYAMDVAKPLVGTGLITAPVSIWKLHRKLIQPTFNQRILDSFVELFAAQSKILTEQLQRHVDGPEFEIINFLFPCTLDMICESAMGIKIETQSEENHYYMEASQRLFSIICQRFFNFWLRLDFVFNRTQLGRDHRKYIKYFHDFCDKVIQQKRNVFVRSNSQPAGTAAVNANDASGDSTPRKKVFLEHLMELSDGGFSLSDKALRDETQTLIMAGSESSALTNSYVILILTYYPDVQEKVYREIYEIYGGDDITERPVTPKDLPRMQYLERVIKETMRIFPVCAHLLRAVTEDLDIGGHILPKGSTVLLAILNLHRNEKYWPDPYKFDPDRFLPEEIAKRHPYSFMGFSGGLRNCVGLNYAMMSMKTLLATVLRRYVLKKDNTTVPIKDIRLKTEITMRPMEPIKIRIERRIRK